MSTGNGGDLAPVSEEKGLMYLWSAIATFNVLYIINLWLLDRTNQTLIDVFHFDNTRESAPIFMLTFGSLVTLTSFVLLRRLMERQKTNGLARLMPIWINIDPGTRTGRRWRAFCGLLTIGLPLVAQVYFWLQFHDWQAWKNELPHSTVELWKPVKPGYVFDWDAHRYGSYGDRLRKSDGFGGVSYLPFWQPLLMAGLSLLVLRAFLRIVGLLRQRRYSAAKHEQ